MFLGIYMLFQMFSIVSVMVFGATVVNLYHHKGDTLLSRSSRRKLIQTLGPLCRIDIPKQLLEDTGRMKETEMQGMNGSLKKPKIKYEIQQEPEMNSGSDLETIVTEWQTIARILDRIFLCIWLVTNITAIIIIIALLE